MLLLALFTIIICVLIYYVSRPYREKSLYPPGPTPLPVVGNILMFRGSKKSTFDDAMQLGRKYGDAKSVTMWFGMKPSIFINSFEGVREALIDNQHDFASRPDMDAFLDLFGDTPDIIFGKYTPKWHAMKKIGSKLLRRVIDSHRLESNVTEATDKVIEALKTSDLSKPIDLVTFTTNCVYSIIAALCFGVQYSMDDPQFLRLLELRRRGNEVPLSVFLILMIPGIGKFPKLLRLYPPWRRMADDNEEQMQFLQGYIDHHKKTVEERRGTSEELRDILDAIQLEQEETIRNGEDMSHLTDAAAKMIIFDIFGAGSETTATTIRWFVLEMALNPEIQEECAEEIRRVIGDGVPNLEDKAELPLVEATVFETLRLHPAAPLAVGHSPSREGALLYGKYPIPMDTQIMYNIWGVHRDPALFPDPERFDPYRYVDNDNTFKPIGWIPFGVGRRVCMGETLAKNDLFLVCTGLLQRLRFRTVPGEEYSTYPDVINGLTNIPVSGLKFMIELR